MATEHLVTVRRSDLVRCGLTQQQISACEEMLMAEMAAGSRAPAPQTTTDQDTTVVPVATTPCHQDGNPLAPPVTWDDHTTVGLGALNWSDEVVK